MGVSLNTDWSLALEVLFHSYLDLAPYVLYLGKMVIGESGIVSHSELKRSSMSRVWLSLFLFSSPVLSLIGVVVTYEVEQILYLSS